MADPVDRELQAVARGLSARYGDETGLQTRVETRWQGPLRVQGLCVWDYATDVFEPVRHRLPGARAWKTRQTPSEAAANIEWFFANRPDLPQSERPHGAEDGK